MDGLDGGGIDRLDQLAAGIGHDACPCATATTSMWPKPAQSKAMKAKAISSQATMRGAGETGVSCSSSAAGRNCRLVRQALRRVEVFADFPDVAEDGGVALEQVERGLQAEGEGLGHFECP
jgi:hypothetical protein